ncbi:hypothetical protein JQ607_18740 [Bradyrhizobium liaoningense]|uniref:hypothetical protein n=1 Tax=Bradyrhizobium liaoningense TaxID=43992 RepID=UPI001BA828FA|nr:hypothetical protein [Bradyrhizobium liaoningense]MBR0842241.1 hypothetical protein [Bradyrhizobium liaoningense]
MSDGAIRPDPVSEVCQPGDILLAFAAAQDLEPLDQRGGAPISIRRKQEPLPSSRDLARNDGEEEEERRSRISKTSGGGDLVTAIQRGASLKYSAGQVGALPH